ncbi:MAG: hypothetical protein E7429_05260 [Ruminococcaceae bacterium]|nr:hypothetical protein [Oscillospiraceae bacterium]
MLKAAGSLCILAGGFLARWQQMAQRRRRRDTLSDLLCALRRMCEEIRCARTPLPTLLHRLGRDCGEDAAGLFLAAAKATAGGEQLADVWRQAAQALPISREAGASLARLGEDLHGDEEQICNAVSLVIQLLARETEEMDRNIRADGQRVSALCLSGAALLVILLI